MAVFTFARYGVVDGAMLCASGWQYVGFRVGWSRRTQKGRGVGRLNARSEQ